MTIAKYMNEKRSHMILNKLKSRRYQIGLMGHMSTEFIMLPEKKNV